MGGPESDSFETSFSNIFFYSTRGFADRL